MLTHGNLRAGPTKAQSCPKGEEICWYPIEDALGTPLRRKPEGSLGSDLELMTHAGQGREGKTEADNLERRPTGAANSCAAEVRGSNPLGSVKLNRARNSVKR